VQAYGATPAHRSFLREAMTGKLEDASGAYGGRRCRLWRHSCQLILPSERPLTGKLEDGDNDLRWAAVEVLAHLCPLILPSESGDRQVGDAFWA